MYSRTALSFSIASFLLLCFAYLVGRFIKFYTLRGDSDAASVLRKVQVGTAAVVAVLIVIGCAMYYAKQREDHASDWSVLRFIFGKTECAHQVADVVYTQDGGIS